MMQIRVYYEDTDAGGVVYHTNYLKYCERARSELFFVRGISPAVNECHFVVKSVHCIYHKPAKLGELLDVQTQPKELKKASVILEQSVYRNSELLFEMDILLAFVSTEGKITKIPKEIGEFFRTVT
jgi:acyl-CoA thioester hydrolase